MNKSAWGTGRSPETPHSGNPAKPDCLLNKEQKKETAKGME
jgi:hypothetical protein